MERRLPIGIQGFVGLINDGFIYVDKTEYIYKLVHSGKSYFLSRPRRFGKSLLISTMKAYWEGRKDIFSRLAIEQLEANDPTAWQPYPVFHFDLNGKNYQDQGALEEVLNTHLSRWERIYFDSERKAPFSERFQDLLIRAYEKTGRRCVILIDEYDKPLLDVIGDTKLREHNKEVFKGFFSTLKSYDEYIRFAFITGVTKFHKVSIFSDLNQLLDISLSDEFSGICGITEKELREYFLPEVAAIAKRLEIDTDECFGILKNTYDGYRFSSDGVNVYNPFSLFNSFFDKDLGSYWFETGTPTFLVKKLREDNFDVRKFTDRTLYASESSLKDYTGDAVDPVPLLYQTGYLTITDYDRRLRRYTLCFPNEEVKFGFIESLIPSYVPSATVGNGLDIFTFDEYIEKGDVEKIMTVLTALFARIPYTIKDAPFEHYFQSVIYLVFTLLGKFVECEMHTFTGRIDCRVQTKDFIYLFEFKRDISAEDALAQIDEKDYSLPFIADRRKTYKIGVSFDSDKRIISEWKISEH